MINKATLRHFNQLMEQMNYDSTHQFLWDFCTHMGKIRTIKMLRMLNPEKGIKETKEFIESYFGPALEVFSKKANLEIFYRRMCEFQAPMFEDIEEPSEELKPEDFFGEDMIETPFDINEINAAFDEVLSRIGEVSCEDDFDPDEPY